MKTKTNSTTLFDLESWKRRFMSNTEEAERNSLMDSGWSLQTAQQCEITALGLYRDIIEALATMTTNAKDFFDRPELVALQEAARYVIDAREDLTMSNESVERFTPTHCAICETRDFTWADCVTGAYKQGLSDAIKEVERLYDEWWDMDRRRCLDVIVKRLKSLGTQRED